MSEKLNVKELIKIGLILFAITAVSAALLAFVNGKTAPLIEKNQILNEQNAIKSVMTDAVNFEEEKITDEINAVADKYTGKINKVYKALDKDNALIGVCVITETTGYDIGIQAATGVSKDLTVNGVDIISMNETPGLGAKAADATFTDQYKGKSLGITVSKSNPGDTQIQAISGATKTSDGVTNGVNIALETAKLLMNGGKE